MSRLSTLLSLAFFILSVFALTHAPSGGLSSYINHTSNGSYTPPYTSSKCLTCNTTMTMTGGGGSGTATPTVPAGKTTGGSGGGGGGSGGGATSAPQNGGAVSALEDVKGVMIVSSIVLGAFVMAMGI
ncbi:hypothetical protein BJ875DRAFT_484452 [Amylocarpus encephaloides]|uniref:Uncharacterized protein n=1 Tax=Amylocarpus encephaloides TaxID=45428 RepID=A0A9P7YI05_9HELO|nr:hypothetical protein BJ875DRAFT_484452 [Amylocarpus encephaloides]